MDLLETVLRTANAMDYIDKFREEGIQAQSLTLLTSEDLEIIGVDDEEIRKAILKRSENLLFATESRINTKINAEYAKLVLLQINNQIKLHNNNLFCAITRPDIVNCDIELHKASNILFKSIEDIKKEVVALKRHVKRADKKKSKRTLFFKGTLLGAFVLTNWFILNRLRLI